MSLYFKTIPIYNGKQLKSYDLSCREIYRIGKTKVLKLDLPARSKIWQENQTKREIEFYTRFLEDEDKQYFPKLYDSGCYTDFGFNVKQHWIVQEFIEFKVPRGQKLPKGTIEILEYLIDKYHIWDIDYDLDKYEDPHNWGINIKTNKPIIYDIGGYSNRKKKKK